jgi:hypothetical protein
MQSLERARAVLKCGEASSLPGRETIDIGLFSTATDVRQEGYF